MIKNNFHFLSCGGNVRTPVWRVLKAVFLLSFPLLTIFGASYKNVHDTWDDGCDFFKNDLKALDIMQANLRYTLEPSYIFGQGILDLLQWRLEHWPYVAVVVLFAGWLVAAFYWCRRPSIRSALALCGIAYIIGTRNLFRFFFALLVYAVYLVKWFYNFIQIVLPGL